MRTINYNHPMDTLLSEEIETPVGTLLAVASNKGLCLLEFADVEGRLTRHLTHLEKIFKSKPVKGESNIIV